MVTGWPAAAQTPPQGWIWFDPALPCRTTIDGDPFATEADGVTPLHTPRCATAPTVHWTTIVSGPASTSPVQVFLLDAGTYYSWNGAAKTATNAGHEKTIGFPIDAPKRFRLYLLDDLSDPSEIAACYGSAAGCVAGPPPGVELAKRLLQPGEFAAVRVITPDPCSMTFPAGECAQTPRIQVRTAHIPQTVNGSRGEVQIWSDGALITAIPSYDPNLEDDGVTPIASTTKGRLREITLDHRLPNRRLEVRLASVDHQSSPANSVDLWTLAETTVRPFADITFPDGPSTCESTPDPITGLAVPCSPRVRWDVDLDTDPGDGQETGLVAPGDQVVLAAVLGGQHFVVRCQSHVGQSFQPGSTLSVDPGQNRLYEVVSVTGGCPSGGVAFTPNQVLRRGVVKGLAPGEAVCALDEERVADHVDPGWLGVITNEIRGPLKDETAALDEIATKLQDAGVEHVRMTVRFHHLFVPDATDPEGFRLDFDKIYGDYFDTFLSSGDNLSLWATFAFSPEQATALPGDPIPWDDGSGVCSISTPVGERRRCPTHPVIWRRLVRRALEYFDQQGIDVPNIEVWQEPDRPGFFSGTSANYLDLLKATRDEVAAFYATTATPRPALWGANSTFGGRRAPARVWDFLEPVLDEAAADPDLIDGVAIHIFSLAGYESETVDAVRFTRQAIADKGLTLPVAVTASSYLAIEGTPQLCSFAELGDAGQVALFRTVGACMATAGAEHGFWYRSSDLWWTLCGADPSALANDRLGLLTEIVDGGGAGDLPVPNPIYFELPKLNLVP